MTAVLCWTPSEHTAGPAEGSYTTFSAGIHYSTSALGLPLQLRNVKPQK